jgi:hypothetical protein
MRRPTRGGRTLKRSTSRVLRHFPQYRPAESALSCSWRSVASRCIASTTSFCTCASVPGFTSSRLDVCRQQERSAWACVGLYVRMCTHICVLRVCARRAHMFTLKNLGAVTARTTSTPRSHLALCVSREGAPFMRVNHA